MADGIQKIELESGRVSGLTIPRLFTQVGENPLEKIEYQKRKVSIRNPDGSIVFEMDKVEVPQFWSQTATDVIAQKYFRKAGVPQLDENGNEILKDGQVVLGSEKSAKQVVSRLTGCWRYWGEKYGFFATSEDAQAFEDEIKFMLINQLAAPNSPQWFNTGLHWAYGINGPAQGHWYVDPDTKQLVKSSDAYSHAQVHACFIQSIKDDLVNEGGIMDLWLREARIFKYGSGSGTNFSSIRGRGERLSSGGVSSGVMSFLRIGDATAGSIKSGGTTRRASKMVILDIDHPEIEDFVNWKAHEEKKAAALIAAGYPSDYEGEAYQTVSGQNSNNSVRVSNAFMQSVLNDGNWDLKWRTDGRTSKTLQAKNFWQQIAEAAWACGDPGLQYDDIINDWHTCPASGRIRASNPCTEFMFLDDTACNLASLNLLKFVNKENGSFDVESFKHAVRLWSIVLEISVLFAQYPSREIAQLSYDYRAMGLGYTNLGAMLMVAGIPYDSPEARAIGAAISAIMTGETYAASAEMSSLFGPFPKFEKNRAEMLKVIRNHRRVAYNAKPEEYEKVSITPVGIDPKVCPDYLLTAAISSWDRALGLGEKFGYRNAQATLIAPTGTISLVMDCDTTGIEPDYSLVKFKKLAGGGYFKIVNQSVKPALKNLGYDEGQIADILRYVLGRSSLKGSPHINETTLQEKGFSVANLEKVESRLPTAFDLTNVFNLNTLGRECLERLGFSERQSTAKSFNLLKELGFSESQIEQANNYICGTMTLEGAPHLREDHYPIFDCANKCGQGKRIIPYLAHIKMMAAVQPLLSGAISKTVNMPHEATVEDVQQAYLESWKLGLKSITVYRDGCKLSQPLSVKAEKVIMKPKRRKMPEERQALTHKFRVGNQEGYLTIGLFEDGSPGEIFVRMSKQGSTLAGLMDSFALAISIGLQYGVPLKVWVDKFIHSRFEPAGFTDNPKIQIAKSIMDYIFRWMALKFLPREDLVDIGLNGLVSDAEQKTIKEVTEKAVTKKVPVVAENIDDVFNFDVRSDAPTCNECGSLMVRSGSCYLCINCGATSGCS